MAERDRLKFDEAFGVPCRETPGDILCFWNKAQAEAIARKRDGASGSY
jgi:hypothetical protein